MCVCALSSDRWGQLRLGSGGGGTCHPQLHTRGYLSFGQVFLRRCPSLQNRIHVYMMEPIVKGLEILDGIFFSSRQMLAHLPGLAPHPSNLSHPIWKDGGNPKSKQLGRPIESVNVVSSISQLMAFPCRVLSAAFIAFSGYCEQYSVRPKKTVCVYRKPRGISPLAGVDVL